MSVEIMSGFGVLNLYVPLNKTAGHYALAPDPSVGQPRAPPSADTALRCHCCGAGHGSSDWDAE